MAKKFRNQEKYSALGQLFRGLGYKGVCVWLVADLEALNFRFSTTFDKC